MLYYSSIIWYQSLRQTFSWLMFYVLTAAWGRKAALDDTMVRVRLPLIPPTHDIEAYFRAQEADIRQAVAEALAKDV